MKRIYQIGFNKCATTSLHAFFTANGMKSAHYDRGRISKVVQENYKNNAPLFQGYEDVQCFSDIEHTGFGGEAVYTAELLFREMHKNDPDGLFILNIRPVEDWIKSRSRHGDGRYLMRARFFYKKNTQEVQDIWRQEYHAHVDAVKDYFSGNENFLVFDVSQHDGDYLKKFLDKHGVEVSSEHWVSAKSWKPNKNVSAETWFGRLKLKFRYWMSALALRLRLR